MRLELHLFLWVTAGLAVLLQLSGGIHLTEKVTSKQSAVRAQLVADDTKTPGIDAVPERIAGRIGAITYDQAIRPLFNVATTAPAPLEEVVMEQPASLPVLKGVLGAQGGRKAVFAREAAGADYITAGIGETVLDYLLKTIGEDFVTAVSPAGEEVRFELRGTGEGN